MADDKFVTHSHCFAVVPGIGYAVAAPNLDQKPARQPQRDEQVPDSLQNSLLRDQLMNRIEVSCLGCGVENVDTIRRSDLASAACGVSKPSAIAHVQQEKEAMESPYIADFERTDVDPIIIDRAGPINGADQVTNMIGMSAFRRYCCKSILSFRARNMDSGSGTNTHH